MDTQALLQAGINAARAGDRAQAVSLLARLVQTDPNSEEGWFWLGLTIDEKSKREFCFQRVLAINPRHVEARHELELLHPPKVQPFVSSSFAEDELQQVPFPSTPLPRPIQRIEPRPEPQIVTPTPILKKAPAPPPAASLEKKKQKFPWGAAIFGTLFFLALVSTGFFILPNLLPDPATLALITPMDTLQTPSPTPNLSYAPRFETSACPVQIPEGVKVDCGYVVLPEDRQGDVTDTIRLAVVIYRSLSSRPAPDPVIYLSGGPGGQAIRWGEASFETVIRPFLQTRDFIVFDPRGVGKSIPALECKELGNTYLQEIQGNILLEQRKSLYEGALQSCRVTLTSSGVNLSAYHSRASADDVADVLTALGYPQANLYAISYGTRVAQLALKQHPDKVRSLILDSVVPLEKTMTSDVDANHEQALQTLFAECTANPACAAAYPNLETMYNETTARLDAAPIQVQVSTPDGKTLSQTVSGKEFKDAVIWSMWSTVSVPYTPQLIARTHQQDMTALGYVLSFPIHAYDDMSLGIYVTVNCLEQVLPTTPGEMDQVLVDLCQEWTGDSMVIEVSQPFTSDIPTLILTGRFDPTTPPSYGSQLSTRMSHSTLVEFPTYGHAPSSADRTGCANSLMQAFVQNPATAPDLTCVTADTPTKFWTPYTGNPPARLESRQVSESGLYVRLPSGWTDIGYGIFRRAATPVDITQIGVQRSASEESAWLAWLITQFNGQRGFDSQPTPNGTRKEGGLIWNLYRTTSQGFPVDLAFTRSGDQTILVLLLSYPEERDANFETIFLSALKGIQ